MKWRHFKWKKKVIALHIYSKGTFYCFKPRKLPKGNELVAVVKTEALCTEISEQAKGSGMGWRGVLPWNSHSKSSPHQA